MAPASPHAGDFWTRDAATGDWGGERTRLEDEGVIVGADSIDEILGNVSGGARTGTIYDGRFEALVTLNLAKLLSWPGATLHANAYQIHGRGLSANDLGGNLMTASNIEATRATRLFDLWVEQVLLDGKVAVRVGQIAADDEFFTSQTAASFINATFGWPALMSASLPSGGAAYPLATPGVRVNYAANDAFTVSTAIFNGDPAGAGPGDAQLRNADGTAFRLDDASFAIVEASYATNQQKDAPGLPAAYKLGAWYHTGQFADQRFDESGQSLAAPDSRGVAARHGSDYGGYFIVDQTVWRDVSGDRDVAVFLRGGGGPSDRNEIELYADAGLNFKGLIPSRTDDVFGVAAAVAEIGPRARALDADVKRFSGIYSPIRDEESVVELMYRYQLTPWWTLQPDLQFVRHPGGGVPQPSDPLRRIPDAFILGLRSAILY